MRALGLAMRYLAAPVTMSHAPGSSRRDVSGGARTVRLAPVAE